jgi:hypothetical protein
MKEWIQETHILTKMKLNIFYTTTSSPTQESMNAKEDKGPGSELRCIWKLEMMRHSIEHLNHKIKISQNDFFFLASIHPLENRISSAYACTIFLIFSFCMASLHM